MKLAVITLHMNGSDKKAYSFWFENIFASIKMMNHLLLLNFAQILLLLFNMIIAARIFFIQYYYHYYCSIFPIDTTSNNIFTRFL